MFRRGAFRKGSQGEAQALANIFDEKNDGVCDRFCTITPSSMRGSRAVACSIQKPR